MLRQLKKRYKDFQEKLHLWKFNRGGKVPWTTGYDEFRWKKISEALRPGGLSAFLNKKPEPGFGAGIDERIVEYPWVFSELNPGAGRLLDAGSTFNFEPIVTHEKLRDKELTIYTYFPEILNFSDRRISYIFGDLRELPFRNDWFDDIACISTLEHIGMDNTMYGYGEGAKNSEKKFHSGYMKAIEEMVRVLKKEGRLFITFPFGKYIDYGYFQQFDSEMIQRIVRLLKPTGICQLTFFRYVSTGWIFSTESECSECEAYNPHTGQGKGPDGAAHSRAVCAIHFTKNK